jgi:vitamin B12 transporter
MRFFIGTFLKVALALCLLIPGFGAGFAGPQAPDNHKPGQTSTDYSKTEKEEEQEQDLDIGEFEVTVTATRTPADTRKLGQSVTVLTAEQIQKLGARTVADVLETVPGVQVARSGSFGSTTTVFVRGGESDFNLVMVDGVKVNQPGGTFDFADLTTTNIDRIEVVRGPSSVLYGANAASAVINIVTKKGKGAPTGNVSAEGGTYSTGDFKGDVSGGTSRIQYSAGAQYFTSDGFHSLNNRYRKRDLSARTSVALTDSSSVSGMVRYLDSEFHIPTDFTGAPVDPNNYRDSKEILYSAGYQNQINDRVQTRLEYGYHNGDYKTFTVQDNIVDFYDSTFEAIHSRHSVDWQSDLYLNGNNLLTAGMSYEKERSGTLDLDRRSFGVYVQDQFSWQDRLLLVAGLRYDDNNSFNNFVSGNLSAGFLLNEEWKIRASVGNGFRAPSFNEIVGFPEFGIVGNDDLRPEKNTALDFGVDFTPQTLPFGVSLTAFFNQYSDLIEFTYLVEPGTPNYLNVQKAQSRGLELEGFFAVNSQVKVGGQYTYNPTEVTDAGSVPGGGFQEGESLLRRPRNQGVIYGEFVRNRLSVRMDFRRKGEREDLMFFPDFTSSRVVLAPYWRTDLSVSIPLFSFGDGNRHVDLLVRGRNIFDTEYTEIAGFQSLGRALFGGLQLAY